MEDLPAKLTIDILSRLPQKTIIYCKLVCKKWRNLASDSLFVNLHLSGLPTGIIIHHDPRIYLAGNLIVPNDPGTLKWVETEGKVGLSSLDLNLAPILQNTRMRLVGSVNGLICLWQYFPKHDNTYVCNPVTREYMILPRQCFQRDGYAGVVYGFGVNSLTGEYKVVRAFERNIPPNAKKPSRTTVLEAEVYTLGIGQWRSRVPVPAPYQLTYASDNFCGPFLNNHCHWIVCGEKIGTFDFDKETFQLFPSPPPVEDDYYHRLSLAILKGCLCKLETYYFELRIWVMKEYGIKNSWHKEVVIRQGISVNQKWPSYRPDVHLLAGLKDGSILMVFGNKLCVFDPRSETYTKMFGPNLSALAYRPSFLKLQNFELETVHMF